MRSHDVAGGIAIEIPSTATVEENVRVDSRGSAFLSRPGLYRLDVERDELHVEAHAGLAELPVGMGSLLLRGVASRCGSRRMTTTATSRAPASEEDFDDFWAWLRSAVRPPVRRPDQSVRRRATWRQGRRPRHLRRVGVRVRLTEPGRGAREWASTGARTCSAAGTGRRSAGTGTARAVGLVPLPLRLVVLGRRPRLGAWCRLGLGLRLVHHCMWADGYLGWCPRGYYDWCGQAGDHHRTSLPGPLV